MLQKPKDYFSHTYCPSTVGQLGHCVCCRHSGNQTENAATVLNPASHHRRDRAQKGLSSAMKAPARKWHTLLPQNWLASPSGMATPNQKEARKCSPIMCLESQARSTWRRALTITPARLCSCPCYPWLSCITRSPLWAFCVCAGHRNYHIAWLLFIVFSSSPQNRVSQEKGLRGCLGDSVG